MKKIIDLGFANGWHDTPDVIKEAKEKGLRQRRSNTTGDIA